MKYLRQSLSPGEEIVYVGHFHWMYTLHAALYVIWGFVGCVLVLYLAEKIEMHVGLLADQGNWLDTLHALHPGIRLGAFLVFLMGLARFAHLMIARAATEIAVTSSRVIYKRGLVARYVGEMSIDRIEGVNILQNIPGRIFGYGRILVRGMGVGEVIFPPLANPVSFRKAIEKARTV